MPSNTESLIISKIKLVRALCLHMQILYNFEAWYYMLISSSSNVPIITGSHI